MIPKIIHYVWLGGNPPSKLMKKCIKSWKKYCPDYEIKVWNETNFDINSNEYLKQAISAKKWAFASDYIRLYVLVAEGGIYMDTDVQVLKSLDPFLNCKSFSGFENATSIPTGIMGCEKGNPFFSKLLSFYDKASFINPDGTLNLTTNVTTITNMCLKYGLKMNNSYQNINGFELFPNDYFCPKDYKTGRVNLTKNTYTIHHFNGSWIPKRDKFLFRLEKIIGTKNIKKLSMLKHKMEVKK